MDPITTAQPLGWFLAKRTRDAEAQRRDGSPFFALNWMASSTEEVVAEVQFGDGMWMLASGDDVHPGGSETANSL
jgi:hypothetical protein